MAAIHLTLADQRLQSTNLNIFNTRIPRYIFAKKPLNTTKLPHWFRATVFRTHVCGSDLDPTWLGRQDALPDISKPYLVNTKISPIDKLLNRFLKKQRLRGGPALSSSAATSR